MATRDKRSAIKCGEQRNIIAKRPSDAVLALDTSDRDVKANLLDVAREYDKLSANSKLK